MELNEDIIKFALATNSNLLVSSSAGYGKSTIILNTLEKLGINTKYIPLSTTDIFLDFLGLPFLEDSNNQGHGEKIFTYATPKALDHKNVQVIFMDEFNRPSSKRVLNAVFSLLQYKKIGDREFPNLKCIFAAINPFDEENETYSVEYLDPAIIDRFQIFLKLDEKVNYEYFKGKFGEKIANTACDFWGKLTKDQRKHCSPRRLDYAISGWKSGGSLRWYLAENIINCSSLETQLSNGSYSDKLKEIFQSRDESLAEKFVNDQNSLYNTKEEIYKNKEMVEFFLPLLNKEEMTNLLKTDKDFHDYIGKNAADFVVSFPNADREFLPPEIKRKLINVENGNKRGNKKDDLNKKFIEAMKEKKIVKKYSLKDNNYIYNYLETNTTKSAQIKLQNIDNLSNYAGRLPKIPATFYAKYDYLTKFDKLNQASSFGQAGVRKNALFSVLELCKTETIDPQDKITKIPVQPFLYNNPTQEHLTNVFEVLCHIVTKNSPEENKDFLYLENLFGFCLAHLLANDWLDDFFTKFVADKHMDFNIIGNFANDLLVNPKAGTIQFNGKKFEVKELENLFASVDTTYTKVDNAMNTWF